MHAADVMVTEVITVTPETTVTEVADLLLQNRISGVPVIDDGRLVGIISEGDLIRRAEANTQRRRSWWLEMLVGGDTLASEYVKSHGRKAADIMTRDVVTATEDTPLSEIADLLERHHIKRVPILRSGALVGIISRANLLQALASMRGKAEPSAKDDQSIREQVLARIRAAPWGKPWGINVTVRNGVVDLWGGVLSQEQKDAFRVAAEGTPGVREVKDNLIVQTYQAGL